MCTCRSGRKLTLEKEPSFVVLERGMVTVTNPNQNGNKTPTRPTDVGGGSESDGRPSEVSLGLVPGHVRSPCRPSP